MKKWSDEELNYIRNNYNSQNIKELSEHLNRSKDAVTSKALELGLTKKMSPRWKKEEIKFLKENYNMLDENVAQKLGRTVSAVRKKRRKLNIASQVEKFKHNEVDTSGIEAGVPFFDFKSKSGQYFVLLSKMKEGESFEYPSDEHQLLRNQIELFPNKKFATKRWSESSRRVWALEGGTYDEFIGNRINASKRWTKEEDKFVLENASKMSVRSLAKEIGRSYSSVVNRISKHKEKNLKRNKWTKEEEEYLIKYKDKYSVKFIAEKLNRSIRSISNKINSLNKKD